MTNHTETDTYGTKRYYRDDKLHRDGGLPAIETADGVKVWYVNDLIHLDGGLPATEWSDGSKAWYVHGNNVSEEQAVFIHNMKIKRAKRVFWRWYNLSIR